MLLNNLESGLNQPRWADWKVLPPRGGPEHCMKRPLGDLTPSMPQVKGHQAPGVGKDISPNPTRGLPYPLRPQESNFLLHPASATSSPVDLSACFPSNEVTQVSPVTKNCPLSPVQERGSWRQCLPPLEGWGAWGRCSSGCPPPQSKVADKYRMPR